MADEEQLQGKNFRNLASKVALHVKDPETDEWVPMEVGSTGGSGSSGEVEIVNPTLAVTQSGEWTVTTTGLTDDQLRAGPIAVTGTFWQGTQPVSIAGALATRPDNSVWTLTSTSADVHVTNTVAVSLPSLPAGSNTIGAVNANKVALTPSSPTSASVGVSTGQIVSSNSSRKGLVITNLSNNVVSLGLGASAVLNSGITLMPYGTWQMDDYTFCTHAVNAIASAGSSAVSIQEFV